MRLSVILSTFNSPTWLEKALWGYAAQIHRNFEILVADDGSNDETRQRIDVMRVRTGMTIRHIWHEDRGFRKCTILNRAIEAAAGDYLVFSDGDCIPRHDFLDVHARLSRLGRFLSGGLYRLPRAASERITRDDIVCGRATDPGWLRSAGVGWSPKLIKLTCRPPISRWLDRLTPTKASWNGHNSSGWKADILAVEMEAAALYAFARARHRPVLCFAHVTNQMGRIDGDFEKGAADGAEQSLLVISIVANCWRANKPDEAP